MQSLPELVLGLKAARKHKEALLEQLPKTREAALALAVSTLISIRDDEIETPWWCPKALMIRATVRDILDILEEGFGIELYERTRTENPQTRSPPQSSRHRHHRLGCLRIIGRSNWNGNYWKREPRLPMAETG